MAKKTLAKLITTAAILAMPIFGNAQNNTKSLSKSLDGIELPNQRDAIPKLKVYSSTIVPSNYCGRYAANISKKQYNKDFERGNAWDMRYSNKIIEKLGDSPYRSLDSLRMIGELDPGMIIGVYNPKSSQNGKKDISGNTRKYTHVLTFAGKNKDGKLIYDHKWGSKTLRIDNEWMKARGIIPKEVLGTSNDLDYTELKRKQSGVKKIIPKKANFIQKG